MLLRTTCMTELGLVRDDAAALRDERPLGTALIVAMLGFIGVLAAAYAVGIGSGRMAFNSGAWLVGEPTAMRGALAYAIFAVLHIVAATALGWSAVAAGLSGSERYPDSLWRARCRRAARVLAIFLIAYGLLPAVPGISAAVIDLHFGAIAFWGAMIVARSAALYVLLGASKS
jgi:hypothetical protein